MFSINQGTNEDDSQNNPLPEAGLFRSQITQDSGPEDGHDMVTEAKKHVRYPNFLVDVFLTIKIFLWINFQKENVTKKGEAF